MFILDTDIVSLFHADHPKLVARISNIPDWQIYTTIITKVEILQARFDYLLKAADAAHLQRAQFWLNTSERALDMVAILAVNQNVSDHFGILKNTRGLGKIGRPDLMIACFALAHDATLVTRNTKDFNRIPNLKLENWIDD